MSVFARIRPSCAVSPVIRSNQQAAGEEGRDLADAIGDKFMSRYCRALLSGALTCRAISARADHVSRPLVEEAGPPRTAPMETFGLITLGAGARVPGAVAAAAHTAAEAALEAAAPWAVSTRTPPVPLANAALATWRRRGGQAGLRCGLAAHVSAEGTVHQKLAPLAEAALGCGDLVAARRWADDTVAVFPGSTKCGADGARA